MSFAEHLKNALRLRCPACGVSPLFVPVRRIRRIDDWFAPLDGCPRCGYAYEPEPGYFLLSTWAINYVFAAAAGLGAYFIAQAAGVRSLAGLLVAATVPTALVALALVRHSKALFLALDVWMNPPARR